MYKLVSLGCIQNNVDIYGGKAVYLSSLIKHNFLVPYGIVIPSDVFQDYKTAKLEERIFDNIAEQIDEIFLKKNIRPIFRSSANIENSDQYSSAGVFSSFVYDSKISIKEHVKKVWESSEDIYASNYFDLIEMDKKTILMGVIVQEYIKGDLTLLIQSYDIINDKSQILIEYTNNGISSLVDGTTNADLLYVNYDGQVVDGIRNDLLSVHILLKIVSDCNKMENVFGAHVEVEAQVLKDDICYLQVRKLL